MTTVVTPRRVRFDWSAAPALAAAAAVAVLCASVGPAVGVLAAWVVAVVWAAGVDARVSRLPDRIVVVGAVVFSAALVVLAVIDGSWSMATSALLGAVVLGIPSAVLHLAAPTGFGYGDVKFGVLVGLGLGVVGPGLGIVVFATAALVQLAVAWWRPWPAQRAPGADRRAAPFGPSLAIAAFGWVAVVLVSGGGL